MLKVNLKSIKLNGASLFENIFFELESSKVYTILGKNGEGKTTLLKSIACLINRNEFALEGEIIYDSKNLLRLSDSELLEIRKQHLRFVFQDSHKSFDQLKTFRYYFELYKNPNSNFDELLSFFQLPAKSKLESMHPYEVSGGMAQRIAFIFAISAKPKILLLDEPTAAVDTGVANLFKIKLKQIVEEEPASVLLVTQDIAFARAVSDRIAYLSNGSLTDFLLPEEFLSLSGNPDLEEFLLFAK